jgi:hypothetical protein
LLSVVAVIGLVVALYGAVQAFYGFAPFEAQWIASREFASLSIGHFIRPFSTFANPEEWSRYLMLAATIGLGRWFMRPARWWWLGLAGVCAVGIVLSAVRTSVFGLIVTIGVLLMLAARTRTVAMWRLLGLAVVVAAYAWLGPAATPIEEQASDIAWDAFFGHTTQGVLAPLAQESLWIRVDLWGDLFTRVIPHYPLGMGLGVPTLGAWRFDSSVPILTESYVMAIFVAAGIIGGGLMLGLMFVVSRWALRLGREAGGDLRIVAAMLIGIVLTSLFGNSLSLYAVGPLGWELMGWLSTKEQRQVRGRIDGSIGSVHLAGDRDAVESAADRRGSRSAPSVAEGGSRN